MSDALELHVTAARDAAAAGKTVADVPQVGSAGEMKTRLQEARATVSTAYEQALEQQQAARELVEAKKRELDQMIRDLNSELAPLKEKMARFEDGIAAVQLYLGRGEEIFVVRDGDTAPADAPVFLRQETLAMDEESAIAAGSGGIDFSNIDMFIEWLQDDENLAQVLPETRGVVACQPRRQAKVYTGDPLYDSELNKNNWFTYWLIRNGERVWLTKGEFIVGNTICPKDTDFTGLFRGRNGEPLRPGSTEWAKAEQRADQMTRHYMKVAMLLQGIVDRTAVLEPHPTGLSFIDQASYERGEIVMITDAERAIGTARAPFPEWIREKRAQLTEGMRIAFDPSLSLGYKEHNGEHGDPANSSPQWVKPGPGIYQVRRYAGSLQSLFDFQFSFQRQGQIWNDREGYVTPKRKATARFSVQDDFFLPIDTVTVEEIDTYLSARTERKHYLKMMPMLTQARELLVREHEEQTPFAMALAGRLTAEFGLDAGEALDLAWDLVQWYRRARKWQEPVQENDAKAFTHSLAEAKRLLDGARNAESVVEAARALPGELLAVARRSSGFIAVFAQETAYPHLHGRPFTRMVELTSHGAVKEERTWQLLKRSSVSRWQMLFTTDEFTALELDAHRGSLMTDDEISDAVEIMRSSEPADHLLQVRVGLRYKEQQVEAWFLSDHERRDKLGRVTRPAGDALLRYKMAIVKNSTIKPGLFSHTQEIRDSNDFLSKEKKYPWEVNWANHVSPNLTVFFDEQVASSAREFAAQKARRERESAQISRLATTIYQQARKAIEMEQEEELKSRYLDDYGTDKGFEVWRQGVRVQLRHPDSLRGALTRDLLSNRPIGGRTLGEIYPDMELWSAATTLVPAPIA